MGKIEEMQASVWEILRETAEKQAETDRKRQEYERFLNEKFAETDRQIKETGQQMKETDRRIKETERLIKENNRQIEKTNKMLGGLSNSHGSFAEEYFVNAFKKRKNRFLGERYDKLIKYEVVNEGKSKVKTEYDILLVNGKSVAIIEVKYKVREKAVEHLIGKIEPFRQTFPEYKNHRIYLGMASLVFDEKVEMECADNGIAVIKQEGDLVVINDKNIRAY